MMRVWLDRANSVDLSLEVAQKAKALQLAAEAGAQFLALPTKDLRDSTTWILASFHSPLTVVPLSPSLPTTVREQRLAQLPQGKVLFADALSTPKEAVALPSRKPLDSVWAVIFTSGSSGTPKGIALSGSALKASALAHAEHSGCANATWLLDLPLFHVGGLSILSRAFFLSADIALSSARFDAKNTAAWIASGRVQGLSLVPTTLFRLLELSIDFSPLALILLGGAAAEENLVAYAHTCGAPVRLTYGMTEHSSQIATERMPGSGLEPLPEVEIRISLDEEILVRSPCLATGIYQGGQLLPLPVQNGFFATGDLGSYKGGKLQIHGRKSDVIVSGGKKIFPNEVEAELTKVPGVKECAIVSLPDPEWGEMVCAMVVEEKAGAFDPQQAKSELALVLESYQIPKRWLITEALPRSEAGKILRSELRRLLSERYSQS